MDHRLSQSDFDRFAQISGDDNPIHVDPAFAAGTRFGATVAHGMLLFGLLHTQINRSYPQHSLVEQSLKFVSPTFADETVVIKVFATQQQPRPGIMQLDTVISRHGVASGHVGDAAQGEALLRISGMPETVMWSEPTYQSEATSLRHLVIGQTAQVTRCYSPADITAYLQLMRCTYDEHVAMEDSGQVPPPLLGGIVSWVLGTRLPGFGTNWLKQHFTFPAPALVNQPITATVSIIRLRPDKALVNLRTTCQNDDGQVVCDGEALVLVKDLEAPMD